MALVAKGNRVEFLPLHFYSTKEFAMKTICSLAIVFGLCALAGAEEPKTVANKSIDGTWTVLSAEKDGKAMGEAKDITVSVLDNVFTVRDKDGKEMRLRMEFTGPGKARVTEDIPASTTAEKPVKDEKSPVSKSAVYVLTNDFLAICVHHDQAEGDIKAASVSEVTGKPSAKSYCSFVLKRADGERK